MQGYALFRRNRSVVYHAPPADSPVCWNGKNFVGDDIDGALNEKVQKSSTFPFLDNSLAGLKPTHVTVSEQVQYRRRSIGVYPFL